MQKLHERNKTVAMPLDTTGQLKFKHRGAYCSGRTARQPNEIIHQDRGWSKQAQNTGPLLAIGIRILWKRGLGWRASRLDWPLHHGPQDRHDVISVCDQNCPLLDQLVAPLSARIDRRAGYREDFPFPARGQTGP